MPHQPAGVVLTRTERRGLASVAAGACLLPASGERDTYVEVSKFVCRVFSLMVLGSCEL